MDIFDNDPARNVTRKSVRRGAYWFYVAAILSVINSLIVYFFGVGNMPIAFGVTQWIDGTSGPATAHHLTPPLNILPLIGNMLIAIAVAGFGYFARKGNDVAFATGIFLYTIDAMLAMFLRDFWGFAVHLVILFFLFKGLLASRHVRENATSM